MRSIKKSVRAMHSYGSSLEKRAFGEHSDNGLVVACASHQLALRFLSASLAHSNGIALLKGSTGSGKTTIVNEQLDWSSRRAAVAMIDGASLTPRHLLQSILSQFEISPVPQHEEFMLQAVNKFAVQQARSAEAPVLIVDNVDRATESALRVLNWLAALDVQGRYALRIVLTGTDRISKLVRSESMRDLAKRNPATYSLNPLTARETMLYLRTRFIAAGGEHSEKVFSLRVCDRLHELSGGWPGRLNDCAFKLLEKMSQKRKGGSVPRVIITCDGETLAEHILTKHQYVIGRADLADIVVDDTYVSKMHALIQVYSNALILLDLNSTNGTTVNSIETQKTILRSNDIISLGRLRLKVENAPVINAETDEQIRASDTLTMQNLEDIRRVRAQHNIAALKHK
jgi:type II secretory pathway predicted ATPase ExeA